MFMPQEDKTDDVKTSFYEESERVFYKFPKYHTKNVLRDFNTKVGNTFLNQQLGRTVCMKLVMIRSSYVCMRGGP
jgi:hypothetical protein